MLVRQLHFCNVGIVPFVVVTVRGATQTENCNSETATLQQLKSNAGAMTTLMYFAELAPCGPGSRCFCNIVCWFLAILVVPPCADGKSNARGGDKQCGAEASPLVRLEM